MPSRSRNKPSADARPRGSAASTAKSTPAPRRPKPPFPDQHQARPGIEAKMMPRPQFRGTSYRAAGKLEGKVALITGGDSGIGRSVAVLFAREGADIAIVFLPAEQSDAAETARVVEESGKRCLLIAGDVTARKFCDSAVSRTVKKFGQLDILVNNAAFQKHQESPEEITDAQWEKTFRTNIHAYFFMARAALRHLPRGGAIVNTGSVTGLEGSEQLLDYSSTKGAIHTFTKSLARNLVSRGIRVNCVAPGPVWTPLNIADKPASEAGKHGEDAPMKRPAQPDEIAPAFVFFASHADSSYITGQVLGILGGETTG